jgi:hypothetical protein
MVLKFSQQMKYAQRTEKYIRLIFNSYISDVIAEILLKVASNTKTEKQTNSSVRR